MGIAVKIDEREKSHSQPIPQRHSPENMERHLPNKIGMANLEEMDINIKLIST
jgi:hypothetical protein